jgi:hypothetical protein
MTTENVIRIEDARELRELGLPILPIVDIEFSDAALKLFFKADKARTQFYRALAAYCKSSKPTKQGYKRIREALDKIVSDRNQAAKFTSAQEGEAMALQSLMTEPMSSFLAFWEEVLASFEEGETVKITITQEMLDGWSISAQTTA